MCIRDRTGASRSECDRSLGVIRLGWADIKTSSPQPRSVRFVEFARTDSASQFDRFLQPCPTTSRPRDIPAGNISCLLYTSVPQMRLGVGRLARYHLVASAPRHSLGRLIELLDVYKRQGHGAAPSRFRGIKVGSAYKGT